jgi:hypothetical protein
VWGKNRTAAGLLTIALAAFACSSEVITQPLAPQHSDWRFAAMAGADLGPGADLHGAVPFPRDNIWNRDISGDPVDPSSAILIASMGAEGHPHPDFGSGTYNGSIIGIPYRLVDGDQAPVAVVFTQYGKQSDPGPYPIPADAPIEGFMPSGQTFAGDRHVITINRTTGLDYEMWEAYPRPDGTWQAAAGAVFSLSSNNPRPSASPGWTSADAAGLPIFPGLVRYDEASRGEIPHALTFTSARTRAACVPPATHWASFMDDPGLPPMGMRVRLRASYRIPGNFSTETRAILVALKKYGMFLIDNGSNWFISGAPDERWKNRTLIRELRQLSGSDFEVIRMTGPGRL